MGESCVENFIDLWPFKSIYKLVHSRRVKLGFYLEKISNMLNFTPFIN